MQDRFKFRAYYKVDKKMHNVNAVIAQENCIELFEAGEEPSPEDFKDIITARKEMCVLMQCTGLKDKNGKLIYEGDIVLGSWKTKLIVIYDVFSSRFMLKTIKGQATEIAYYTCFDTQGEDIYCKNLEILGNIYENKDLLAKDTTNE